MIDTTAIRNKTLLFAMSGQLTEQKDEEGTGEDLLKRLIDKKRFLERLGSMKKEKELPEKPDDEKYFDIPMSWEWAYLGDIFQHNTGKALNSSDSEGELLEYITTSNLYWDRFELDELRQMYFKPEEIDKCTVTKGDLLICEGGDIGRSAIWKFNFDIRIQNHIHKLRGIIPEETCTEFFYYLMRLYKQNGWINGRGIGLQGFSSKRVHSLVVPLPPYQEQIRIAERLHKVFEILDEIDDFQSQYSSDREVLKSKLINVGIQGKLTEQFPEDGTAEELCRRIKEKKETFIKNGRIKRSKEPCEIKEDELLFDIPSNWKWERWGNIVNIVSARRVHQSDWRKDGIPFYRAREIAKLAESGYVENDLFISRELYDDFSKSGVPQPGDLMVTAVGTLGKTYVVRDDDVFYYKDASVICFENYADLYPEYLKYVMDSEMMRQQIESNSGGTTVDTLTMVRMIEYLIPLPPLEEQKRIADRLNELLRLC